MNSNRQTVMQSHQISFATAVASIALFASAKTEIVGGNFTDISDFPDYFSIDLDILETYIAEIRAKLNAINVRSKGIKFTLARYPATIIDPKANPLYAGKISLIAGPVDLEAYAQANSGGLPEPEETSEMRAIPLLNYMHLTPPH